MKILFEQNECSFITVIFFLKEYQQWRVDNAGKYDLLEKNEKMYKCLLEIGNDFQDSPKSMSLRNER